MNNRQNQDRICCVSLNSLPVLDPSAGGLFGGTETRAWTICRGLAQHPDVDVSLVVRNRSMKQSARVEDVEIVPKHEPLYWSRHAAINSLEYQPTFPFIKIRQWSWKLPAHFGVLAVTQAIRSMGGYQPRPQRLYTTMNCARYFTFGVNSESATVIASSKANGKTSVLFLGADSDLDERFQRHSRYRSQYGERASTCHYILTQADFIVAQTTSQQAKLKTLFNRDALVLPNPIDLDKWSNPDTAMWSEEPLASIPFNKYVLWIGRADDFHKRPQLMIELARELPSINFVMLMNRRDTAIAERIESEKPPNVHIITHLHFREMPALFQRAKVFLSTSNPAFEGFPNTFLQAAATDTPIVSLDVCEDFLRESSAGIYAAGDMAMTRNAIEDFWNESNSNGESQSKARAYLESHHDVGRLTKMLVEATAKAPNS